MRHDAAAYRAGHRCRDCRAAHAEWMRSQRARRFGERVLIGGVWFHRRAKHGTRSGYEYWGCRCPHCTTANTQCHITWRATKRGATT